MSLLVSTSIFLWLSLLLLAYNGPLALCVTRLTCCLPPRVTQTNMGSTWNQLKICIYFKIKNILALLTLAMGRLHKHEKRGVHLGNISTLSPQFGLFTSVSQSSPDIRHTHIELQQKSLMSIFNQNDSYQNSTKITHIQKQHKSLI